VSDEKAEHGGHEQRDRLLTIAEAVLLSVVALLAAWSGFAASRWSTQSRLDLAAASSARGAATRADLSALDLRNFDSSTFNAWFAAYAVGNEDAMALARRRFRPDFAVAFTAWRATKPETNPDAPRGPTYMPQYKRPELAMARRLDDEADAAHDTGVKAAGDSNSYVRTTVFLATVLFLVGISTQFPLRGARYALIGVAAVLLVFSLVLLAQLPRPPS
jgi:hypothetical protein